MFENNIDIARDVAQDGKLIIFMRESKSGKAWLSSCGASMKHRGMLCNEVGERWRLFFGFLTIVQPVNLHCKLDGITFSDRSRWYSGHHLISGAMVR